MPLGDVAQGGPDMRMIDRRRLPRRWCLVATTGIDAIPSVLCNNSILSMFDGEPRVFLEHDGYDIPYRSLIPLGLANMLVAGRCQSATRRAFGSIRGIAICMVLGQAAGTAAALAAEGKTDVRSVPIAALQARLVQAGNVLDV